jgi:tricorn protease-like protein
MRRKIETQGIIGDLAFAPSGNMIAGANERGEIVLWDVNSGTHVNSGTQRRIFKDP